MEVAERLLKVRGVSVLAESDWGEVATNYVQPSGHRDRREWLPHPTVAGERYAQHPPRQVEKTNLHSSDCK